MNGIALHGGLQPAGGTFLCFTDYAARRCASRRWRRSRSIYVMTHDSIGLGEDGPTHQPVEHLAALRAMPNMRVFRPADAVETAECWQLALERPDGPTVLALTRQNLAPARTTAHHGQPLRAGAYELSPAAGEAAGDRSSPPAPRSRSRSTAPEARRGAASRARRLGALAGAVPASSPRNVGNAVIGKAPVKIAVEAAVRFGWDAVIGPDGLFVGMHSFGAQRARTRTSTRISASPPRRWSSCGDAPSSRLRLPQNQKGAS